jgi:hypothetical protein
MGPANVDNSQVGYLTFSKYPVCLHYPLPNRPLVIPTHLSLLPSLILRLLDPTKFILLIPPVGGKLPILGVVRRIGHSSLPRLVPVLPLQRLQMCANAHHTTLHKPMNTANALGSLVDDLSASLDNAFPVNKLDTPLIEVGLLPPKPRRPSADPPSPRRGRGSKEPGRWLDLETENYYVIYHKFQGALRPNASSRSPRQVSTRDSAMLTV